MALPWMESVNVWGDEPKKNKPARLRCVFA
jgi:hypothetical protein